VSRTARRTGIHGRVVVHGRGGTSGPEQVADGAAEPRRRLRDPKATFGDYLIPVNADVPDLDVTFVGAAHRFSPIGIKGLDDIGILGVPAAIANAVYHATGRRFRSPPITIDQLR